MRGKSAESIAVVVEGSALSIPWRSAGRGNDGALPSAHAPAKVLGA